MTIFPVALNGSLHKAQMSFTMQTAFPTVVNWTKHPHLLGYVQKTDVVVLGYLYWFFLVHGILISASYWAKTVRNL